MIQFLSGPTLSKKIFEIMAASDPCMSVAFLGPGWLEKCFSGSIPPELRIICDLAMNVTTQVALKQAGAPNNANLRHLCRQEMHGKVYLSSEGAIVCSANATQTAFFSETRIEDGVFLPPDDKAYAEVLAMFNERFESAQQIKKKDLETAPKDFHTPAPACDLSQETTCGLSLDEALLRKPADFSGIFFVFSKVEVPKETKDAANEQFERGENETPAIPLRSKRGHFSDWDIDKKDWPALFVSIHLGARGGFYIRVRTHSQ